MWEWCCKTDKKGSYLHTGNYKLQPLTLRSTTTNIVYFWLCSKVNVCHCQFFGHFHQFQSYSFGHLDSVKWITLNKSFFSDSHHTRLVSTVLIFVHCKMLLFNFKALNLYCTQGLQVLYFKIEVLVKLLTWKIMVEVYTLSNR